MTIIFDGKKFAKAREAKLKKRVASLKKKGVVPKLATFVDHANASVMFYTKIKKDFAERIGVELETYRVNKLRGMAPVTASIRLLNTDDSVHGIMVQLPLPGSLKLKANTQKILDCIDHKKDVDGLTSKSSFISPVILAIEHAMQEAGVDKKDQIAVVGAKGMEGKKIVKYLSFKGYSVVGYDKSERSFERALSKKDVVISATGKADLIRPNMVRDQAVVIDIGYPKPDVHESVKLKTRFITPVPGGIGPVTVVSLFENLVTAAEKY